MSSPTEMAGGQDGQDGQDSSDSSRSSTAVAQDPLAITVEADPPSSSPESPKSESPDQVIGGSGKVSEGMDGSGDGGGDGGGDGSGDGGGDGSDSVFYRYSSKELYNIREKSANRWPDFLDESFRNYRGFWDPDKWHQGKNNNNNQDGKVRRLLGKDRIKESGSTDTIVLSPQRRSFLGGCQPAPSASDEPEISLRPETAGGGNAANQQRRVGSGRILNRDRERGASGDGNEFGRNNRFGGNESRNTSGNANRCGFDRRGEHFEMNDKWTRDEDHRGGNRRNNERRNNNNNRFNRMSESSNAEPEWMSAPISQGDVMELRGFEDEPSPDKISPKKAKNKPPPVKEVVHKEIIQHEKQDIISNKDLPKTSDDFNLDDFLHMDSIPGLANILADDPIISDKPMEDDLIPPGGGGSRFSQFFRGKQQQINDAPPVIRIPSPGESKNYFAPVSPAAKTAEQQPQQQPPSNNPLLDMLTRKTQSNESGFPQMGGPQMPPMGFPGGDVKSVEELEAGISGLNIPKEQQPPQPKNEKSELSAFNKFAALIEGQQGGVVPAHPPSLPHIQPRSQAIIRPSPVNLHPMSAAAAAHQHEIESQILLPPHLILPPQHTQPHPPQHPQPHQPPPPPNDLFQFIHQSPFQRDVLLNVLKVQQQQGRLPTASNDVLPPMGSPSLYPGNGNGGLSVSPTNQQRVPSPQELVYYTQQIMQNALIKRKLEEQKENYKKRQHETTNEDSSLAFTPTVVMKKMAAEHRRDSDPKQPIPELKINDNNNSEMMAAAAADMQQRMGSPNLGHRIPPPGSGMIPPSNPPNNQILLQQLHHAAAIQQQLQIAALQQQDRRSPINRFFNNAAAVNAPIPPQPQMQGDGALSRFFSADVLAQAQSGNVPSMPPIPTQKALTLEEIERQAAAAASVRI